MDQITEQSLSTSERWSRGLSGFGNSILFAVPAIPANLRLAGQRGLLPPMGGPGAKLLSEYRRFRGQGFTSAQARYLTKPYPVADMGGHFIPRRFSPPKGIIPQAIVEHPLNIMGRGMSRGRFYERHYLGDPRFHGTKFPRSIGGTWSGAAIGLTKAHRPLNLWHAAPDWLRVTGIGATASGAVGTYWLMSDD